MSKKYMITTFGCQMNVHDSEILAGLLESLGYQRTETTEEADLILLNTCCVRENAENRTFGHIGNLKNLKQQKPRLIIGVCGCMVQQPAITAKIKESFPHVDLVFGTHNLHCFPEMLEEVVTGRKRVFEIWETEGAIYEGLPLKRNDPFKAWVTIMYGCNNFCSYCVVPHVRGRERSRATEKIVDEIRALADDGVVEVALLGQNVNSYGKDLGLTEGFANLLREVAKVRGIRRIRFQTSHPKDLSPTLIQVMRDEEKVCRQLHLPVQSGSTHVLKLMNRQYSKEQYEDLVAEIKRQIPGIALTTDIIVGFPGERHQDFLDTLDLVAKVRYDGAFTFIYSPRLNTPAATMENQVPDKEQKLRILELIKLQNQISLEKNQALVSTLQEILVEGPSEKEPAIWAGRTTHNKMVHFRPNPSISTGNFAMAHITSAQTFTLEGELLV